MEKIDSYSDLDSDSEDVDELSQKFNLAVQHLPSLVHECNDTTILTRLYALYKIVTVGECNVPKPAWYNIQAKLKWEAWNNAKSISKESAMEEYISIIEKLDPTWQPNVESKQKSESWISVSSLAKSETEISDEEKTIFDFVRDGNVEMVDAILKQEPDKVNQLDNEGLGLIHWACDRGNAEMLEILIRHNIDVNLQASDGQTGLHYAASCGHIDCVKSLLNNNANINVVDEYGSKPVDVAETPIFNLITSHQCLELK